MFTSTGTLSVNFLECNLFERPGAVRIECTTFVRNHCQHWLQADFECNFFWVQLFNSSVQNIRVNSNCDRVTGWQPFFGCPCTRCRRHRGYSFPFRAFILLPTVFPLIRSPIPCEISTEISKFRVRFQELKWDFTWDFIGYAEWNCFSGLALRWTGIAEPVDL